MSLPTAIGLILLGLLLLAGGGELLVRGATTAARLAGLTPAVIGLTVVAMGTSLPELVVSLLAAARGEPDLAMGNVVGSNIFNVAAILGITALVFPLPVRSSVVRLEWPVMFVVSFAALVLARDGLVGRLEGTFFLASLAFFTAYTVRLARREVAGAERVEFEEAVEDRSLHPPRSRRTLTAAAGIVAGLALLVVGGRLLVDGAVATARLAGMTERVIGLTIVAAGTSAPELATSLIAAARGQPDVAVANIIGSNVFNILGILGLTAVIAPVPVAAGIIHADMWWMMATAVLLFPLMLSGMRIGRAEGGLLLAVYGAYLAVLLRGA